MEKILLGAAIMWLVWGADLYFNGVRGDVKKGKTFKINDSTYKCKMINTLTYGEKE